MEISMGVSQKAKNNTTMWSCYTTPGCINDPNNVYTCEQMNNLKK
jgi:hypothetical protein